MTDANSQSPPASVVDIPSPLEGQDLHKLEYIKTMVEIVQDDIKHRKAHAQGQ